MKALAVTFTIVACFAAVMIQHPCGDGPVWRGLRMTPPGAHYCNMLAIERGQRHERY